MILFLKNWQNEKVFNIFKSQSSSYFMFYNCIVQCSSFLVFLSALWRLNEIKFQHVCVQRILSKIENPTYFSNLIDNRAVKYKRRLHILQWWYKWSSTRDIKYSGILTFLVVFTYILYLDAYLTITNFCLGHSLWEWRG
jgi:hypothetical protein